MTIYKIINTINGKIYIGQTTECNPENRIKDHFKKTRSKDLVRDAAKKYGKESLKWEIIYYAFDLEELNRAERYFIVQYNSLVPHGYNIQKGGNGKGKWSELSKIENGKKVKEWYKHNQHPSKGKNFSEEHISNLSKVRKGFDSPARKAAREISHSKIRIPIISINIKTQEERLHNSISECAKIMGLESTNISRVLNGKSNRTQHKGYTFRYVNKENNQTQIKEPSKMKGIHSINKGGYAIKILGKYLGWTKDLNEAMQIRDKYLDNIQQEGIV